MALHTANTVYPTLVNLIETAIISELRRHRESIDCDRLLRRLEFIILLREDGSGIREVLYRSESRGLG